MVAKKRTGPRKCRCGETLESKMAHIELQGSAEQLKRKIDYCAACDMYEINGKRFNTATREQRAVRAALEKYDFSGYWEGFRIKQYKII